MYSKHFLLLPLLFSLLLLQIKLSSSICVLDNKKGWWLDCGLKDTYLFRVKDLGGILARFDFGFEVGDEVGFPYSVTNVKRRNSYGGHDAHDVPTSGSFPYKFEEIMSIPASQTFYSSSLSSFSPSYQQNTFPTYSSQSSVPSTPIYSSKPPSAGYSHQRSKYPPYGTPIRRSDSGTTKISRRQSSKPERPSFWNSLMSWFNPTTTTPPPPQVYYIQDFVNKIEPEKPKIKSRSGNPSPTLGPELAGLLKLPLDTPADTDNVPSFAAKMFVIRESPREYHPPDFAGPVRDNFFSTFVRIPRTKFYCEEQKYLPGLYADMQLGCKVFHLCVPAAIGSTVTSYLCPNGTLFDQSILRCNYWYSVECQTSNEHYDTNLPLSQSYRKMNAAHMALSAASNLHALALLSQADSVPPSNAIRRNSRVLENPEDFGIKADDDDVDDDVDDDDEVKEGGTVT